jgi:hypothetical protein
VIAVLDINALVRKLEVRVNGVSGGLGETLCDLPKDKSTNTYFDVKSPLDVQASGGDFFFRAGLAGAVTSVLITFFSFARSKRFNSSRSFSSACSFFADSHAAVLARRGAPD